VLGGETSFSVGRLLLGAAEPKTCGLWRALKTSRSMVFLTL
jgi:hypothetical protein